MNLPVRTRPRLSPIFRRLHPDLSRIASSVAWRALHPHARGQFLEAPRPPAARRLYYRADDGWQAPLFCISPRPGAAGEPVCIAHGLLGGPDLARYGTHSLVGALRDAGFAVYLLSWRGDREAIAPRGRGGDLDLDAIVERDLPAALAAVTRDSGYPRVHLIGHGFGGVLALATAGRRDPALATVVALAAPVGVNAAFPAPGLGSAALAWVPGAWTVPLRTAARWASVFVSEDSGAASAFLARQCFPSRLRGALMYTTGDPPVRLLRAMRGWLAGGAALQGGAIELGARLAEAEVPLLVVTGTDDPICPPAAGEAALEGWGHADRRAIRAPGSHLDLLLGVEAAERVFGPVVSWLVDRRRHAWVSRADADHDPVPVS